MKADQNKENGLSFSNRRLLVVLFFAVLLLWGSVDPFGIYVRTFYLATLPTLFWFILSYFGRKWKTDTLANDRLTRGIVGIVAGALFVGAYLSFTAMHHVECTQSVRTIDGSECVG